MNTELILKVKNFMNELSPRKRRLVIFIGVIALIIIVSYISALLQRQTFGIERSTTFGIPGAAVSSSFKLGGAADDGQSAVPMMARDFVSSDESLIYEEEIGYNPVDPSIERRIIRDGNLDIVVGDVTKALESVKSIAEARNGYISNSNLYKDSFDILRGSATVTVPEDLFVSTMNDLKLLAREIRSENVTSRDVTEEYIDLEARLANHIAREQRYLDLLERADTVEEIILVQQQIDNTRLEIERLEGRLKYLNSQTSYSRIYVNLTPEQDAVQSESTWKPINSLKGGWYNLKYGLTNLADKLIRFIIKLPLYILWIVIIYIVIRILFGLIKNSGKIWNRFTRGKEGNSETKNSANKNNQKR